MELSRPRTAIAAHLALASFVTLVFLPGLDNFLAGDDFNWVQDGARCILDPTYFVVPRYHFVRHVEMAYWILGLAVAGGSALWFQIVALVIHVANALLLSLVAARVTASRASGLLAALLWAVSYKHVEVVLRPYAVADSLALLFCLAALLLVMSDRWGWACAVYPLALFSKENALVLPVFVVMWVVLQRSPGDRQRLLARSLGLWAQALVFAGLETALRLSASSQVNPQPGMVGRFWENLLTYVGPDAVFLREAVLGWDHPLVPTWLGLIGLAALALALLRMGEPYRLAILWTLVFMAPSVILPFQASRYHYVPLVGVAIAVGHGLVRLVSALEDGGRQLLARGLAVGATLLVLLSLVGVNAEESDFEQAGEYHRQAVESYRADILPRVPDDGEWVAVFVKPEEARWQRELYATQLLRPWFVPATYKWIYPRPSGILGLADTYGFVTYCAWGRRRHPLFVPVSDEEYRQALVSGRFYVVVHDYDTNTFHLGPDSLRAEIARRADDRSLRTFLQPGRFDPALADPSR